LKLNLWSSDNSLRASVSAKQNTEHALMTEADSDRSLHLVLDHGHGTGEQQCWPTSISQSISQL